LLVKADLGNVFPLGVTKSGAVYLQTMRTDQEIEIIPVDLAAGKEVGQALRPIRQFTGTNTQPAWSPDGRLLAYQSTRAKPLAIGMGQGTASTSVIGIMTVETGEIRELRPALAYFQGLTWTPDADALLVFGGDANGRVGVFRVDGRTGGTTPVIAPISSREPLSYEGFFWSPDRARLYYHRQNGTVHEWRFATSTERVVASGFGPVSLSPDGRWIAASQKGSIVVLVSTEDVTTRELMRVSIPTRINNTAMAVQEIASREILPRSNVRMPAPGCNSCTAGPKTTRKNAMPPSHSAMPTRCRNKLKVYQEDMIPPDGSA
jgi:hypothetical protein